jgi:hypothetical protein
MKFDNLKMFPENRIHSLFGLEPSVLAEVAIRVLPVLEERREHRLRNSPHRKRRFITRDGRPREVLPIDKLLMSLLYLRHNTSATMVGQMFNFSADSAENAFGGSIACLERFVSGGAMGSRRAASESEMVAR